MDTKREFLDILSDYIDLDTENVDLDLPMKMAAGVNSFVFLSIISAVEEHFSVQIPNDRLSSFNTLSDIISYLQEHCGE